VERQHADDFGRNQVRFRVESRFDLMVTRAPVQVPDSAHTYAVDSPQRLSVDRGHAARLLDLVPSFPTVTWGHDDLRTGEMWNSTVYGTVRGHGRAVEDADPVRCGPGRQRDASGDLSPGPGPGTPVRLCCVA